MSLKRARALHTALWTASHVCVVLRCSSGVGWGVFRIMFCPLHRLHLLHHVLALVRLMITKACPTGIARAPAVHLHQESCAYQIDVTCKCGIDAAVPAPFLLQISQIIRGTCSTVGMRGTCIFARCHALYAPFSWPALYTSSRLSAVRNAQNVQTIQYSLFFAY
jgi:hypothetical protein